MKCNETFTKYEEKTIPTTLTGSALWAALPLTINAIF